MPRRLVQSADLPPALRRAFWAEEVCQHLYGIEPEGWAESERFHFRWETRDLERFGFAHLDAATAVRRRRRSDIARDGFAAIAVQRACAGPLHVSLARDSLALRQGDWVVLAMDWPHEIRGDGRVALDSLELPPAVFAPLLRGGALRRPVTITASSPVGALLAAGFDATWKQLPDLGPALGEGALRQLAGLVALACGASESGADEARRSLTAARLCAVQNHIAGHLADPGLSPASVAAALGISVRYLHRLFEGTGESFAEHVMRKRLAACRAALENPAEAGRSVADIAFGYGFASLPTFYRGFATAYGARPADLRPTDLRPTDLRPTDLRPTDLRPTGR